MISVSDGFIVEVQPFCYIFGYFRPTYLEQSLLCHTHTASFFLFILPRVPGSNLLVPLAPRTSVSVLPQIKPTRNYRLGNRLGYCYRIGIMKQNSFIFDSYLPPHLFLQQKITILTFLPIVIFYVYLKFCILQKKIFQNQILNYIFYN